MIQFDRVTKFYSEQTLFSELTWQLKPGQRVGLIGPNGAGKTTLFRIMMGEVEPDEGRFVVPRGTTIGMLPQEVDELDSQPIIDIVLEGKPEVMAMEREIEALQGEIDDRCSLAHSPHELEPLSERLGHLLLAFEMAGGYRLRPKAHEILAGMGFPQSEHDRPANQLSGGWRMRVLLSKLLFQRPDVLLMDEPTNHLDVPSLEWLEGFLQGYEGTVVVISHDRYFLNRLVEQIAALQPDGFAVYFGNFDSYLQAREERLETLKRQKHQQDRKVQQLERFIERFRSKATKARQVQSRVKQLDKLERVELPQESSRSIRFRFPEAPRAGRVVVQLAGVAKRYDSLQVYRGLDFEVQRGERVALIGPNGGGKSTLLKLIAGNIVADEGLVSLGHQVLPSYFAQHQVEALDLNRTVLEQMQDQSTSETRTRCRSILGGFLFSGEDADKRISVLSGGERSKLVLATMLLRPTNLLLLDEPTNHLDMSSREVVLEALLGYPGTIIFVSHDRQFINDLATRVVHVEAGRCTSYLGDYEYYRYKRELEAHGADDGILEEGSLSSTTAQGSRGSSTNASDGALKRKEQRRLEAERRNEMYRRTQGLRTEFDQVEVEISESEQRLGELEECLADPALYGDPSKARLVGEEHRELKDRLANYYDDWSRLGEKLESIERELMAE